MNLRTTHNEQVATEPMRADAAPHSKRMSGMNLLDDRFSLVGLKVLFNYPEHGLAPGDTIYIDPVNARQHKWSGIVYKLDEIEFILIPIGSVLVSEAPPYANSAESF